MEQKVITILNFTKIYRLYLSLSISDIQFTFNRFPFNFHFHSHLFHFSYFCFDTIVMFDEIQQVLKMKNEKNGKWDKWSILGGIQTALPVTDQSFYLIYVMRVWPGRPQNNGKLNRVWRRRVQSQSFVLIPRTNSSPKQIMKTITRSDWSFYSMSQLSENILGWNMGQVEV